MSVATVQNLGGYLGAFELTTPSGRVVRITPEQEERIAMAALEERLLLKLNETERLKGAAIDATIGAVGNAIGFAVGGYLLGRVIGVPGR